MKIFLLLLTILIVSEAQVLGIDFGTQFWKASLISPGKNLVIVQNSRSGRKTINGLTIQDSVRHFEDDALYKRLKKPHMSYFYLNKLLRSLDFEKPLENYHFQNGTYYITHEDEKISLEQLVGMILKDIKVHASHQAGSDIKDAVLSIPPSWGWKSKMALINAAQIADLSVLGLINQNSAAAINFAITRSDSDPINIGFFNLGSHNLQFSIIQFFGYKDETKGKNIQSLKVLSHVVVEDVGGLQVDRAIADYLSNEFYKLHKLDPRTKQRSYVKLLHQAAEAKQTLSANKEAQVYVEGIMDGKDLNLPISREIVEKLDVFRNLHKYLDEGLEKAGISKSQLNSVELIGGASRIPLVARIVKQHFDDIEVGSHINGDEAMAYGSSLRAANLSIAFRVKQLHFYDGFEKDIKCVISSQDEIIDEELLFNKDSQHGDKAVIHLSPPEKQIKIDLFYGDQLVKSYSSENITAWKTVYNESAFNFTTHPNVVLGFVLSTTNIADLKETYVNLTINKTQIKTVDDWIEEEVKPEPEEEQKNDEPNDEKTDEKTDQKAEGDNDEAKDTQANSTLEEEANNTEASNKTKKAKTPKKKLVKVSKQVEEHKIQNKKYQIQTSEIFCKYSRYTRQQVQKNQKILYKFEKNEKYLKEKSKIRNDLESTLYRLKDSYEDPYVLKFSQDSELQNLKKVVSEKLEWLDENAWTAEKDDFEKQFNHVYQAYSPMYNRSVENSERQKMYNETMQSMSFAYQKTLQLNNTHSWLEDKIISHLEKINETVEQIHSKLKKQHDQQLNVNPLIYNNEMLELAEKLRDEYYLIKMIPRPKPVKAPKKQSKKEEKKESTQEDKFDQKEEDQKEDQKQEQTQSQKQETAQQAQEQVQNEQSSFENAEEQDQQQNTDQAQTEQEEKTDDL